MGLSGSLIIENFGFGVSETDLPLFVDEEPLTDEETGEQQTQKYKILSIVPVLGTRLELRVAASEWERFLDELAKTTEPLMQDEATT